MAIKKAWYNLLFTAPELPLSSQTPILWPAGCPASCRAADKAPTGTEPSPPTELQGASELDPGTPRFV